jgi:2-polyprenyl-6-hydroxyphenyl methylase/3-demethylubiquinone-9 3-methyltransferase
MVRFDFGRNWQAFLSVVEERHIDEAQKALVAMIGPLEGRSFLDAGSGSGLMSLAARRLGARVHSFDYSAASVACAQHLKARFLGDDPGWTIEQGDVLDEGYLAKLSRYDIVYSWGVLHHTGDMWKAMGNADRLVAENGLLFIAIYNDLKWRSRLWVAIKRYYNKAPLLMRKVLELGTLVLHWLPRVICDLAQHADPTRRWRSYHRNRGMSAWYDVVDWVGGYPFEVATPEQVFEFYKYRGYVLEQLRTCGDRHGCNEFVFRRVTK